MVAKIGCRRVLQSVGILLRPHQLGFGTKGGAEGIVHAVIHYVHSPVSTPQVLVKLVKNAFNSIFSDNMLEQAKTYVPQLYHFFFQCYSESSILSFEEDIILFESGCQQGDHLGPLLFCLASQPLVSTLTSS